jgi:D-alanyl-D-alanine carboxypeptidase
MRSNITGDERLLRTEPAKALETMIQAATDAGVHLNLQSGYRSYNLQVGLYNSYVKQQGRAAADRSSARPGYSEHQTGLAADLGGTTQPVCNVADCYADTIEGKWLAANAYRYGFIVRYTSIKESITGYEYEPWHVRYIGASLAAQMRTTGIETLEEFFSVTGGTAY